MNNRPHEAGEVHTQILRLALGIEESRAYWAHVDPTTSPAVQVANAFEQRWFGAKTAARVRTLLAYLEVRYDAFPEALETLRRWRHMEPDTRQVICHWHVQLTDPLYRSFTGKFLVERRRQPQPAVDLNVVRRWVELEYPGRWATSTLIQFASKLISAGAEAGLLSTRRDPRQLKLPLVTNAALGYLLYLLRGVDFEGSLLANPYLASVGLDGVILDQRLRSLPGLEYRRMGELQDIEWRAPNLAAWADATL